VVPAEYRSACHQCGEQGETSVPKLVIVTREGVERTAWADSGLSVMEAIRGADVDELQAICGGCCACATCHVYVDESFLNRLPETTEDESDLLESSNYRQPSSRLSCQIPLTSDLDGLRVTIAPED